MGKHLVYVASAFVIIMILCAITVSSSKKGTSTQKQVTNQINNIQIEENTAVTTNIWDYLRSQKEENTIGDSNNDTQSQDDEPHLTVVLK